MRFSPFAILLLGTLLAGCGRSSAEQPSPSVTDAGEHAVATFAGGCFWCMEPPFDRIDGVLSTTSGFTGGHVENPSYSQVTAGGTGHYEAVRVVFDPGVVDYEALLDVYWRNVDPLDGGGQFCDRGDHYRAAIFAHTADQRLLAEKSRRVLEESGRFDRPIVTEILEAGAFYPAAEEHQDFYLKNPVHYRRYREACGRDARLNELWGDR